MSYCELHHHHWYSLPVRFIGELLCIYSDRKGHRLRRCAINHKTFPLFWAVPQCCIDPLVPRCAYTCVLLRGASIIG